MEKTIDRRTARTKRALHEALMALILRKGYEATRVQDIIDEADIGRSTFYAHYNGKEDLLRSGFQALRAELAEARSAARSVGAEPLGFSLALFEHACAYEPIYRALVRGRGGLIAINEIRRTLLDVVSKEMPEEWEGHAIPRDVRVQFTVGAFMAILTWCLERGSKRKPAEVDAMFRQLVLNGIVSANDDAPGSGAATANGGRDRSDGVNYRTSPAR